MADVGAPANGVARSRGVRWILLAGGLKASPLAQQIHGSALDLLLSPDQTALERWLSTIAAAAPASEGVAGVWVAHGGPSARPGDPQSAQGLHVEVVADPRSVRGPAGIARDIAADWSPDALVMIAEAKRCLTCPVAPMILEHRSRRADVTVAANADAAPAGLYLLERRWLDLVPSAGFMDLKEQWLKRVQERGGDVRVHRLPGSGSMPIRSREQFLAAAMALAGIEPRERLRRFSVFDRVPSNQEGCFNVMGRGAARGAGAVVRDSVLMEGASVGAGAVVVRTIVLPGAVIQPGAEVVDAVATPRGVLSDSGVRSGSENQQAPA